MLQLSARDQEVVALLTQGLDVKSHHAEADNQQVDIIQITPQYPQEYRRAQYS